MYREMRILSFLSFLSIALLIVMLVNVMTTVANSDSYSLLREELQENRQLWRSQTLKDYQYIYQQQCFCPPPSNNSLEVFVKNDTIIKTVNLNNNENIKDLTFAKTVEELFNIIEDAIKRNADEILITYDSLLGYPTRVAIDYEKILADEEITYTVEKLTKLN